MVDYISDNIYSSEFSLENIINDLGLSKHELSLILKPFGGFKCCVNRLRAEEAYRIIRLGLGDNFSLNRIAVDLGFKSESTFRRVFREVFGYAPSEVKPLGRTGSCRVDMFRSPFVSAWYAA